MIIKDLQALVNKRRENQAKVKSAQKLVIGMGILAITGIVIGILCVANKNKREELKRNELDSLETIKDTIEQEIVAMKESAIKTEQDIRAVIKNVSEKTEDIQKDIQDGYHAVTKDIHKTTENISKELNN